MEPQEDVKPAVTVDRVRYACETDPDEMGERVMADVVFIVITLIFFALGAALVHGLDRITGQAEEDEAGTQGMSR